MTKILDNNILLLAKSQEFKEVLINEAIRALSVLRAVVISRTITSPPATPAADHFYIVSVGSTGAWANKTNKIAYPVIDVNGSAVSGQWNFYDPTGIVFCASEVAFLRWTGAIWDTIAGSGDMNKAVYDPDNRGANLQTWLRNRANHTGEQEIATITGLAAQLLALSSAIDSKGVGDMLESEYVLGDGVVKTASKIDGIESASNSTFYGKNSSGDEGFFAAAGSGDMLKSEFVDNGGSGIVLAAKNLDASVVPNTGDWIYGKLSGVRGFFDLATRIFQSLFNLDNLSTFQTGDLIYYDGSKFIRLPKDGSTSKFLNGNLGWSTPSANPDVMPITIPVPEVGTVPIPIVAFPYNKSINSIIQRKTAAGTATFDLRIDATNISGISGVTASTSPGTNTATANNTMTANSSVLNLNITSVSGASMLFFVIVFD